jgi:nicotinamidase-related amidase
VVDFLVVPRKMALLNIDLQNVFVEGSPIAAPDGLAVVDRVNRLSAVCRRAGVLVVHTAHVTRPDGSNVGVMSEVSSAEAQRQRRCTHGSMCRQAISCSKSLDSVPFTAPISS